MFKNNKIYQVDAFTSEMFKGNPAGVVLLETPVSEVWMQNIAMEMNLSETAYVIANGDDYDIRFFTPQNEIDLCGLATLSSAHTMFELGVVKSDQKIIFNAKGGRLEISKEGDFIVMNFPSYSLQKMEVPEKFEMIMGFRPKEIYSCDYGWVLAVAENEASIENAKPLFSEMESNGMGHSMITAKSEKENIDFVCRCFAPEFGIDEDPVTGSAHCALTPYWTKELGAKSLNSFQASKRSGKLIVKMIGDRVKIKGKALSVFSIDVLR